MTDSQISEIEVTPDMIEAGVLELRKHVSDKFVLSDQEIISLVLQSVLSNHIDRPWM